MVGILQPMAISKLNYAPNIECKTHAVISTNQKFYLVEKTKTKIPYGGSHHI